MTPEMLARKLREWRARTGLSRTEAEAVLGISARTIEGIENGRGFTYAHLLLHFIATVKLEELK